jgi:thiosulfate dehydrogenase (quinone) large subunit
VNNILTKKGNLVQDPPLARFLFSDRRAAWLWLGLRVWLGYKWITAAMGKIDNPAWVQTGEALKGFWAGAVAIPETGNPRIAFDWYRGFIQFLLDTESYTWFAKLVAYGELLVGIALIVGAFTGIAALFGALMNWNFMMAGAASTNPVLLIVAVGLVLAWKVSGYVGLDHWLLPIIGTPWQAEPADEDEEVGTRGAGQLEQQPA